MPSTGAGVDTAAQKVVDRRNATIETNGTLSISEYRQRAWLLRSQKWLNLLPSGEWMGRKVLGQGICGIVGRFDYQGNNTKIPSSIAIKQTAERRSQHAMCRESKFLRLLTATGNPHIVKLYKGYHLEGGSGTMADLDPLPFGNPGDFKQVARIYLEFVQGGDTRQFMKERLQDNPNYIIPEEHLWRMLDCLARAIHVLEFGHDNQGKPPDPTWKRPICHLDIKPANILIGDRDLKPGDHHFLEIFKLADFGLSLFDRSSASTPTQREWLTWAQWRGTPAYQAPEQHFITQVNRSISCQTNVWGIGAFILQLITKNPVEILKWFTYTTQHTGTVDTIQISGSANILCNPSSCPYSSELIEIICRALTHKPGERITATELLKKTSEVLKIYDNMLKAEPRTPRVDALKNDNCRSCNKLPSGYITRAPDNIPKTENHNLTSTYMDENMQARAGNYKESPKSYSIENSFGPTWLSSPERKTIKEVPGMKENYRYRTLTKSPKNIKRAASAPALRTANASGQRKKSKPYAPQPPRRTLRNATSVPNSPIPRHLCLPPGLNTAPGTSNPSPVTTPTTAPTTALPSPSIATLRLSRSLQHDEFKPMRPGGAGRHVRFASPDPPAP